MRKIKENRFYQALEDVFLGANIQGKSGYVNLLRIKAEYYKIILEKFKKDVDNEPIITEVFKEEFFDKLYSFFDKYFSESGSVYFVKTANWQRVYEKVYTDNKDVVLFWKTHILYYVKSDILFQSISVEISEGWANYNFFFDVENLKSKQNNEKRQIVFTFREIKEEKTDEELLNNKKGKKIFIFDVAHSENGCKTKIDDIVKKTKIPEPIVEKAFNTFKKQSETDFFINKNAEKFLTEQLDMYLHQILLNEENKFEQNRLDQLKTIKSFALKIIKFIAQFEDELVRVWNKPKFALGSNYVITIDKLTEPIVQSIAKHENLKEQVKEWQELGMIDENFDFKDVFDNGVLKKLNQKYKYLPVDTKYFKDLEIEIIGKFDDLDEALDGRLIHSENYQALNTLQEKYKGKVQCIYIDPPFNLGHNADFVYKVNYKDANWATLLENRIRLAHRLLADSGSIFVRCDYNGNYIVRCLLDEIFGKENFINEIIVNKSNRIKTKGIRYPSWHDDIFLYSKDLNKNFFNHVAKKRKQQSWRQMDNKGEVWSVIPKEFIDKISKENIKYNDKGQPVSRARIILGKEVLPPDGRRFPSQEAIIEMEQKGCIKLNGVGTPQMLNSEEIFLSDTWTDIFGYDSQWDFSTENSETLLQRVIKTGSKKDDIILDFFTGSATTQAVAQKLGRKWLGIEMGDHFDTVDLPRLKLVIFGKQTGISKSFEKKFKGGGFFKYCTLEQYEDTLRNMKYKQGSPNSIFDTKKPFEQYIFYADQKFAHILETEKNKLEVNFDRLYNEIDFAETISNLLGLPIKKITPDSVILKDQNAENREKKIKTDLKNMTDEEKLEFVRLLKPLLWWGE